MLLIHGFLPHSLTHRMPKYHQLLVNIAADTKRGRGVLRPLESHIIFYLRYKLDAACVLRSFASTMTASNDDRGDLFEGK